MDAVANLSCGGMLTETFVNGVPVMLLLMPQHINQCNFLQVEVEVYDICDELQVSWLGWDYKGFATPNGTWFVQRVN